MTHMHDLQYCTSCGTVISDETTTLGDKGMYSNTHQFKRDDAVKIGSGASFRDYVPTTEETKWIGTWEEFHAAKGVKCWNEDQTEICLHLPAGYKFSIQFPDHPK